MKDYIRLCGKKEACPEGTFCGSPFDYGMKFEDDKINEVMFMGYGAINFDNILNSLNLVFMSLTKNGWS